MDPTTVISDVAGVATAVGVGFGAVQLFLGRAQARTAFEDGVSAQYRQLVKPRLGEALLASLSTEDRQRVRPLYEYFDLCNEQVFMRMQGRIRRRTWVEWAEGIEANLARDPIKEAWDIARSHLSEFNELRLLMDHGGDPRAWNPWWRRALRRELSASDRRIKVRAARLQA